MTAPKPDIDNVGDEPVDPYKKATGNVLQNIIDKPIQFIDDFTGEPRDGIISDASASRIYKEVCALIATEVAKAEKKGQTAILRGFRRRDFVRGDFYEVAVRDRLVRLSEERKT